MQQAEYYRLVLMTLTLPAVTATVESSFSTIQRILKFMNCLRSTVLHDRLLSLAVLNMAFGNPNFYTTLNSVEGFSPSPKTAIQVAAT